MWMRITNDSEDLKFSTTRSIVIGENDRDKVTQVEDIARIARGLIYEAMTL